MPDHRTNGEILFESIDSQREAASCASKAPPLRRHPIGVIPDRLLNTIDNERGFPPCLVFERGDDSLTSRLASKQASVAEQRTMLYAVPLRFRILDAAVSCVALTSCA